MACGVARTIAVAVGILTGGIGIAPSALRAQQAAPLQQVQPPVIQAPAGHSPAVVAPGAPPKTSPAQATPAQAAPPQPLQGELFQLSGSCAAPDASVTSLAPLPHLTATLQERMSVRVLAIGNWVASGTGMQGQSRFTSELEDILERSVKDLDLVFTHRGASGESTAATSERLKQEVALLDPDLILWHVGSYDALTHVPVAEFEATLSGAVDWIKSRDKDVVLVGLQYTKGLSKDPHYRAMKDAVGRVAARHNVLLVRRYEAVQFLATASREQAKLSQSDFMTTALGYRCMAEHIARALVINVFARRATQKRIDQIANGRALTGQPPVPPAPK